MPYWNFEYTIVLSPDQFFHVCPVANFVPRPRPAFCRLHAVWKSGRGPGIFSHMSDVKIERVVVERVKLCVGALGPEQRKEPIGYQVTYHTYLASGRRLSYTPSVECIVGWTICKTQPVLPFFLITSSKDTRLSPLFRTARDRKLGGPLALKYRIWTPSLEKLGSVNIRMAVKNCRC